MITVVHYDVRDKTSSPVSTVSHVFILFYNAVILSVCICAVFNNYTDAT
jgi:hypothetical protein